MIIGDRLRQLREKKMLSQGDVERKTGLLRCYISRVENGHTVPGIETLEKLARALEVPLYQLFYNGDKPSEFPTAFDGDHSRSPGWGNSGKDAAYLQKLRDFMGEAEEKNRKLVFLLAQKLVSRSRRTQTSG